MLDNIPLKINLNTFVQTVDEPEKSNIGSPIKVPPELRITTLLGVLQLPMYNVHFVQYIFPRNRTRYRDILLNKVHIVKCTVSQM